MATSAADTPDIRGVLSAAELAARRERAVRAAVTAAAAHGVRSEQPAVLHDLFSVVVHLRPHPVVVRVPTVLTPSVAADPQRQVARQRDELAVVRRLHDDGFPIIPQSDLLPAEPLVCDGFAMTAWTFVEHLPTPDEAPDRPSDDVIALVASLHTRLATHPGDLPFLDFWNDGTIPENLGLLEHQPDLFGSEDIARAREEFARLDTVLRSREAFRTHFPDSTLQVVHGDAPTFNRVQTPDGPLIADFELATVGPVEWDMALLADGLDAYDTQATAGGRVALDRRLLEVMGAARMLQLVSCLALLPQLPALALGLLPMAAVWRTTPVAAGIGR